MNTRVSLSPGQKIGAEPQLPTVTIAEERSTVIANVYFSRTLRGTTSISPSHANWTCSARAPAPSERTDALIATPARTERLLIVLTEIWEAEALRSAPALIVGFRLWVRKI